MSSAQQARALARSSSNNCRIAQKSVTHAESESSVDDVDVADASVLAEEVLDVSLANVVRQVADKDPG